MMNSKTSFKQWLNARVVRQNGVRDASDVRARDAFLALTDKWRWRLFEKENQSSAGRLIADGW